MADIAQNFAVLSKALDLRAQRHQVLASNIANADTPGYKARDIDFAAALRDAGDAGPVSLGSLRVTSARHISGTANNEPAAALYRSAQQPSIDGNTVDMDMERNRFAENAVQTEALLTFIRDKFKELTAAVSP